MDENQKVKSSDTKPLIVGLIAGGFCSFIVTFAVTFNPEKPAATSERSESAAPKMSYRQYSEKLVELRIKALEEELRCEITKQVNKAHPDEIGWPCSEVDPSYEDRLKELVKFRDYYLGEG